MAEVTGLLLAAGSSRRFGGNKLVANLDCQPLIFHSARALSVCDKVIAVVRSDDPVLHQLLQQIDMEMVINFKAEQGMGSSIATGVKASEDSYGWCLLPADMPTVPASITRAIIDKLRQGANIAAPFYKDQRGHPVGFGKLFRAQLQALTGDCGARKILASHPQQLARLDVGDAGILHDIDTREDFEKMRLTERIDG